MKKFLFPACSCLLAALLTGCSLFSSREVTVNFDDSPDRMREYFRNELVNYNGLALESENFLRGSLMLEDLNDNPQDVLNKLNEYYRISGNLKYLLIAADLCRCVAIQADDADAIRCHLSSFYYAARHAQAKQKANLSNPDANTFYDFSVAQNLQDYNEACCGIFSYLKKRNLLDCDSVTLLDMEGRSFILKKPIYQLSIPPDAIEEFSLCASYTVRDLMQMNRQAGLGVPLVGKIKFKQWYSALKTPPGLTIPVTLLLKLEKGTNGANVLRLVFVDTGMQENFQAQLANFQQLNAPMALDFSTPMAVFLDSLTSRNLLAQMLDAFEQEASDGLYMIEPYQPNKIPVVFIHGLMSSPETWGQMINSLKNDPTIRHRYQFWFFSYSTGAPVILSAAKLHAALLAAQQEFCTTPEATANFNQMVLVGHSMGGLLTRLMVQQSPYYMQEKMLGAPRSQIVEKLQPEDLQFLDITLFPSLDFVHRVVFMATPHRGANMAQSPIAKLGISLIQLPALLLNREDDLQRIQRMIDPEQKKLQTRSKFFTGIDNLAPDNGFVRAIGVSPFKADLTYHCVIGNLKADNAPEGSDGVVPYWSSHLDGAASEVVVKSNHSVHRRPAAIQELLRILLLHLQE